MKKLIIAALLIGMMSSCKDDHTKKMELIQEKERLLFLSSRIETQNISHWTDSMMVVIDSNLVVLDQKQVNNK